MKLQIVSTRDPSFTYAVYSQHIKSGKFYIERLQGDAVLLHITELQDQDAGEYECEVPTTENGFVVTYSAKMHLSGMRGNGLPMLSIFKNPFKCYHLL